LPVASPVRRSARQVPAATDAAQVDRYFHGCSGACGVVMPVSRRHARKEDNPRHSIATEWKTLMRMQRSDDVFSDENYKSPRPPGSREEDAWLSDKQLARYAGDQVLAASCFGATETAVSPRQRLDGSAAPAPQVSRPRRSWQCGWRPARGASVPCRRSPCTRRCGAACSLDWC